MKESYYLVMSADETTVFGSLLWAHGVVSCEVSSHGFANTKGKER